MSLRDTGIILRARSLQVPFKKTKVIVELQGQSRSPLDGVIVEWRSTITTDL